MPGKILGLRSILIQLVQRRADSRDHKTGKGAVLSLDRLLNLLDNIRRKTDRFINSRRILRNFKFSHISTPHCKCIAYSLLANRRNLCIAIALLKRYTYKWGEEMDLSTEILAHYLAQENTQILFPDLQLNGKEIVALQSYRTLCKIREIVRDETLDDPECFARIEEIICAFEEIGSDGGTRHDFG